MNTMQAFLAWFESVHPMTPMAFAIVAFGGLIMGVAPSSLPLIGVVVGLVGSEEHTRKRARGVRLALGFVLGQASVDAVVGALFGFLGAVAIKAPADYLALTNLLIAALLAVLGLALLRKIRIILPVLTPAIRKADSFIGAYALGVPFGLASCPACTPMLLPVLGAAAATGEPWLGAVLLFCFGLARGIPVFIAGTAAGAVKHLEALTAWVPTIERGSGILLLVAAVYFFYQSGVYAGWVPPLWALGLP